MCEVAYKFGVISKRTIFFSLQQGKICTNREIKIQLESKCVCSCFRYRIIDSIGSHADILSFPSSCQSYKKAGVGLYGRCLNSIPSGNIHRLTVAKGLVLLPGSTKVV